MPDTRSDSDGLSDIAYRAILDLLFRGELKGGDTVNEVELSRQLNVSRTPVHAAVRDLIHDGLVRREAGRRPFVSRITRDDLREIFEMRRLLEGESAYRAAENMDRQTMQRLRTDLEALETAAPEDLTLARWSTHDDGFHEAVAFSSGHMRLASDVLRYRRIHHALNSIRMQVDLIPDALAEHRRILAAIVARDPEGARSGMQDHLREWQSYYVNLFNLPS